MFLKGSKNDICQVPDINFGHLLFREPQGPDCEVLSYDNVNFSDFENYIKLLIESGYEKKDGHNFDINTFMSFLKGDANVIMAYFPEINQMRVVAQAAYFPFDYNDNSNEKITTSKLTMVKLHDYGESLVLRLSDGRFIIFDGGWENESNANNLMEVLAMQSPFDKPVIAAWIFTHPHVDHYRCFLVFYPKYKDDVVIEKIICNFPEANDDLSKKLINFTVKYTDEIECMRRFEDLVSECSATKIRAHTGQILNIANARMELLSSPDDTMHFPCDANILSLVFKMYIDGQTIIFGGDGLFKESLLGERYGTYLKADILQVPHHAFNSEESEVYKLIYPETCLVEVAEGVFYHFMCIYYESNQTLLYDLDVKDFITATDNSIVLDLPYKPRPNGKLLYFNKITEMQKRIGAKSWFFTDLTFDSSEFTILNTTNMDVTIFATLYFENSAYNTSGIKINMNSRSVKKIDFSNPASVDDDFTKLNDIPTDKCFTVRFFSPVPVVISGEKSPAYFS